MVHRSLISGVLAAALVAASTASFAGDLSPAGTEDPTILPVAPVGTLGGVGAGAIVAGTAAVLAIAAIVAANDDDDDDDSPSATE